MLQAIKKGKKPGKQEVPSPGYGTEDNPWRKKSHDHEPITQYLA